MTPEELAAEQERSAEDLRRDAYLCGEFWDALKAAKIPDDLAAEFNDALNDPTVETQALWAVLVAECPDLPFKAHTLRRHRAGHR